MIHSHDLRAALDVALVHFDADAFLVKLLGLDLLRERAARPEDFLVLLFLGDDRDDDDLRRAPRAAAGRGRRRRHAP